jgi:RNA polymerase-binding transcription factor DksA
MPPGARGDQDWSAARRLLLDRWRQFVAKVARLEHDLDWLASNVEPELLEEGQEQALARLLERLDEHDRDEIGAIDRALERMGRGMYGICTACGSAIPVARLHAIPTAEWCRPCAETRGAPRAM